MRRGLPGPRQSGFTMTELIVVIVVIGLSAAAVLRALPLGRAGAPTAAQITVAEQLAQERMELILGTRQTLGYLLIGDPCPGVQKPCSAVTGYTLTVTGVSPVVSWSVDANTNHFKVVTVSVTGPTGHVLSTLTAVLGNY